MNSLLDAVVIGSGPNGLVAANKLADAGWRVEVFEANAMPGGAVKSSELMEPGFINDHYSAFYPLGAGSPVMKSLHLEDHGLVWTHAPVVVAHPSSDGTCPIISRDLDETADSLGVDGDAWRALYQIWQIKGDQLLDALFNPFPPVRAATKLLRTTAWNELIDLARFAVLPVRRLGEEHFRQDPARRLLGGLALHADLLPEANLSGFYGWLLASLGQSVGFPSPRGGSSKLTEALIARLESKGGSVRCNAPVDEVLVRGGRAVGVRLASGDRIDAGRAVLADVDAPQLFTKLLDPSNVPSDLRRSIERFQWDSGTVKVDWNLNGPVPWTAAGARKAGTVHIADSLDELSITASALARGVTPDDPFLLLGQQSMGDPSRAPEGCETVWAYTHVPIGATDSTESKLRVANAMQARIEALAPGFGDLVRVRSVAGPRDLQNGNRSLVGGALGGGTSQLHQQLIFRPTPGTGLPDTHIPGLFLASSSAHPGGGVHGACGANAAKAALRSPLRTRFFKLVGAAGKLQQRNKSPLVP